MPFPDLPPLPANPYASPATPAAPTKTSGLAIASLVLGILSCPFLILAGIPGIVCGIMGLNRIARSERTPGGPRLTGQGLAIAGLILSSLTTLAVPVMLGLLLPAVQAARESARRSMCSNNLRMLSMGMLHHETIHGLLPAAITDADGRPLLSWRVAILPYLGEEELYEAFHLDEPWDSEHNRPLIARMPLVYTCPSAPRDDGTTRYLLLDGPGTAFETSRLVAGEDDAARVRGVKMSTLPGGGAQTLLIVEAPTDRAVEWTKPEELSVTADEAASFQDQGGHPAGIRQAAYADGRIETIHPR